MNAADVASWATEAFEWAVAEEIINGRKNEMGVISLAAKENSQRCELAKIMAYFCEIYAIELEHVNCF